MIDSDTLEVKRNHGQTSGHSFANFVTVAKTKSLATTAGGGGDGAEFIAVDLGDNYPRGINVHRMTATKKTSKNVYAFKTKHANCAAEDQSTCGATGGHGSNPIYAKYEEISTSTITFYKQVRAHKPPFCVAHICCVLDSIVCACSHPHPPPLSPSSLTVPVERQQRVHRDCPRWRR